VTGVRGLRAVTGRGHRPPVNDGSRLKRNGFGRAATKVEDEAVEPPRARIVELDEKPVLTELGPAGHASDNDVNPAHVVCHESVEPEGTTS
jgi:hypothetical protein